MKMMDIVKIILIFSAAYALKTTAFASDEVVDVPEEELAKESVLPLFDDPTSVRKRNVVTAGRFELGVMNGMALTEAIANVSKLGVNLYYNFNEDHALGLFYATHQTGLSSYANDLNTQFNLDFNRAPSPVNSILVDYNLNAYYGKMSITDQTVINMKLYFTFSVGQVTFKHGGRFAVIDAVTREITKYVDIQNVTQSYNVVSIGLGQKFYFTNRFALRFDLRVQGNEAPNPILKSFMSDKSDPPEYKNFNIGFHQSTVLDSGLIYLF